jgi:hypothetical protein
VTAAIEYTDDDGNSHEVRYEHFLEQGAWKVTRVEQITELVGEFETYAEARALWDRLHDEAERA